MSSILSSILFSLDSKSALYIGLFLLPILAGVGLPITEEIILIIGGYLVYLEYTKFWPTIYILIAGIIVGDCIMYFLGKFAGGWISEKVSRFRFARMLLEKSKYYLERYGEGTILFSRLLPHVRCAIPFLAGHFRISFAKFILWDAIASIPWTIALVSISYYLGSGLDLITEVREIKWAIFIFIILIIGGYAVFKLLRNLHKNSV